MARMAKDEPQALKDCPINIQCMRAITADEVYAACKKILLQHAIRHPPPDCSNL